MAWQVDRRSFLRASAVGAASLLSRRAVGAKDAAGKLRVAAIGTGNQGRSDLVQVAASGHVEVTALCDVDQSRPHLGWAAERFPRAECFADYRRLLDQAQAFDAVIVATPDHMHAPIALAAMELGKHVYCEKPLTHTVQEARQMCRAAERYRVVTQMGNQIQSHPFYRTAVKLVRDGAIGRVREVHSWHSGRMTWLLTEERPADADPIPATLDWDLWLGVAPPRPYKAELYHPINWRAWQDFSSGQLGDFGCHLFDPIFRALELGAPQSVEADAPPHNHEVWTPWCRVSYQFPGTTWTAADVLPITWHDGRGRKPNGRELGLPDGYEFPRVGSVLVGESGSLVLPHVGQPQLLPDERYRHYELPVLEAVNHYTSWVDACLGEGQTTSHFGYAGPLTEAVLLGVVAIRFPGERLRWDASAGRITNHADANGCLDKEYRAGWLSAAG